MADTNPFNLLFILGIEETFWETTVNERTAIALLKLRSFKKKKNLNNIPIRLSFSEIFIL